MRDRLLAWPDLTPGRQICLHNLAHLRLDLRQILRCEGFIAREVVIETVFDGRTDGHLRAGIEFLDRHREHVRGVMADQFERFRIFSGNDTKVRIALNRPEKIPLLAVDFRHKCGLCQAWANRSGHLGGCDIPGKSHRFAVRQNDRHLGRCSGRGHHFSVPRKAGPSGSGAAKSRRRFGVWNAPARPSVYVSAA